MAVDTPLRPAGHLPHKGEIEEEPFCSTRNSGGATDIQMKWGARVLPLSPLVGEMPGRAEGGAFDEYAWMEWRQ